MCIRDRYKMFGINAELLIDHAWVYEPVTIADIKAYRPQTNSISCLLYTSIADYGYERAPITKEDMYSVMGKTMDVLASIIFPNCTCRDELINVCYREENDYLTVHGGELYPDVEKTLDELSERYDLYIVSNCQRGYIESFFAYHGLGRYFKDTECYGNNELEKSENIKPVSYTHLDVYKRQHLLLHQEA